MISGMHIVPSLKFINIKVSLYMSMATLSHSLIIGFAVKNTHLPCITEESNHQPNLNSNNNNLITNKLNLNSNNTI